MKEHVPLPGGLLATYPDFIAAALVMVLSIIVAYGVKISSKFNIFFAVLNLSVIVFIISKFQIFFFLQRTKYVSFYEDCENVKRLKTS